MGAGETLDEASVRVLGMAFDVLESDWRERVEAEAGSADADGGE